MLKYVKRLDHLRPLSYGASYHECFWFCLKNLPILIAKKKHFVPNVLFSVLNESKVITIYQAIEKKNESRIWNFEPFNCVPLYRSYHIHSNPNWICWYRKYVSLQGISLFIFIFRQTKDSLICLCDFQHNLDRKLLNFGNYYLKWFMIMIGSNLHDQCRIKKLSILIDLALKKKYGFACGANLCCGNCTPIYH